MYVLQVYECDLCVCIMCMYVCMGSKGRRHDVSSMEVRGDVLQVYECVYVCIVCMYVWVVKIGDMTCRTWSFVDAYVLQVYECDLCVCIMCMYV